MSRSLLAAVTVTALTVVAAGATITAAPLHSRVHAIVGTLQKVDGQTLTIQTAKGKENVTVSSSAKIREGSKTMTVADLSKEAGARVKIRYTEKGGQKEAESVMVSPPSSSQTARAETKAAPKVSK